MISRSIIHQTAQNPHSKILYDPPNRNTPSLNHLPEPSPLEIKIALSLASLADDDEWQIKDPSQAYDKRRLRELDFWFGATTATAADLDR